LGITISKNTPYTILGVHSLKDKFGVSQGKSGYANRPLMLHGIKPAPNYQALRVPLSEFLYLSGEGRFCFFGGFSGGLCLVRLLAGINMGMCETLVVYGMVWILGDADEQMNALADRIIMVDNTPGK